MSERTALILLPGLLCDARLWKSQADALGDIADINIADMTLDDTMAGMAARALDGAPARFALAGLSMGWVRGVRNHASGIREGHKAGVARYRCEI